MNLLLPIQILATLGMSILYCLLILLGWITIPLAAACGAYVKTDDNLGKPYDGPIYHFTWPLMWLYDNKIDGIANRNYWKAPTEIRLILPIKIFKIKEFKINIKICNVNTYWQLFLQTVYWSASRNPVSNLRFVPLLSFKINPTKVRFVGSFINFAELHKAGSHKLVAKYFSKEPHWFFSWQGVYSCFYLRTKTRELMIGWKVYPKDIFGLEKTSYRYESTGLGLQFKKVN